MTWRRLTVASSRTHHELDGVPAYPDRFDDVLAFHAPGLAPVQLGAEAWHITPAGEPAYSDRFARTFGYYEGLAAVLSDDGWMHIDVRGTPAYSQRYAWCGNFGGNRCTVRGKNNEYWHIGPTGAASYSERWSYAGDYREGIAVVQADHGRSTHIDITGQRVHDRWFLDLDVFHKGYARARDEDGWMHVDHSGEPAYARRFAMVEPFYNGQARVEREDGALEVIDERGETIRELRPALRSDFAALSADMVGFWKTQTIATAVQLGVFEALPGTAEDVAGRCRSHADLTLRLLRGLGELRLVELTQGHWAATPRGEYLRAQHPLTLADAAVEYSDRFSEMWRGLRVALALLGGSARPRVFDDVAAEPAAVRAHHRMLSSYARHDYPAIVDALELRGDERLVDAGGGLGVLAQLLLDRHPGLDVAVLDRPEVVVEAQRTWRVPRSPQWVSGDLFDPWGIRADVVVLARVLHDWDDEDALRILRRAREVLPSGGCVYLVEMLLPEHGHAGGLCDLHLLAVTGGRDRTAAEYQHLLDAAGFDTAEVRAVSALPSVVVGRAK